MAEAHWNRSGRRSGGYRNWSIMLSSQQGGAAIFMAQARKISKELGIPLWRVLRRGLRILEADNPAHRAGERGP